MSKHAQLVFAVFMLAIAMAAIEMATEDWRSEAIAHEEQRCKDKSPEFRAVMARLPGEAHSVEACLQVIKFGSKDWVPEMGAVLPPDKMKLQIK